MARETWTDERMGDLATKVDKGFAEAKVAVRDLRSDMDKGFAEAKVEVRDLRADMDKGFARVDSDIREVRGEMREFRTEVNMRFDSMQRTMIIGFAGIVASTVGSVIAAVLVA